MHRQKSGEEELIDAYLEFSEEERHGGLLVIGGQLVILVFVWLAESRPNESTIGQLNVFLRIVEKRQMRGGRGRLSKKINRAHDQLIT